MSLPVLLSSLAGRRQFIVWELVPPTAEQIHNATARGKVAKPDKIPVDPNRPAAVDGRTRTGLELDAQDPRAWMTAEQALAYHLAGWPVGIVIYDGCGLFCIDLDRALEPTGTWSPLALNTLSRFPGAAVEISASGNGLHVIGSCAPMPPHRTRRAGLPLEVYTRARFIALTGTGLTGDPRTDHTAALAAFIAEHLPDAVGEREAEWTTGPYVGWRGGGSDEQILATLRSRSSARAIFGNGASFGDLYDANTQALAAAYPDPTGQSDFDESSADIALANHLAYATGYDCERTLRLMQGAALRRDKWDRPDYLPRTILRAIAGKIPEAGAAQPSDLPTPPPGVAAPSIPAASGIIPLPPATVVPAVEVAPGPAHAAGGENVATTPGAPSLGAVVPLPPGAKPGGFEAGHYVLAHEQTRLFEGCVYVRDVHQILMPDGGLLASGPFNAHFGGLSFQMTADGQKPTKEAWQCFLFSEMIHFPRVDGVLFNPALPSHELVYREGQRFLNTYQPVHVEKRAGDVSLFLDHLHRLYPNGNDAGILLAYLAACVQYQGVKFKWAAFLQGVEGNGKTFFSKCVEYAVGPKFTHWPRADMLHKQFNAAFFGKLLVCVEDVRVSEAQQSLWETLKPMITGEQLEVEKKGIDSSVERDVCFNFVLNSNHRSGLRKTQNDRRICPLFGAQQMDTHLIRDGLTEDYFTRLWAWARNEGGYAAVAHYLSTYAIPDELNPATRCIRAPTTTSTAAAIIAGRGAVEQEIYEAIAEGRAGFRGGWINSMAFDNLLGEIGKARSITRNVRREMLESLGYRVHPMLPEGGRVLLPDGTRPVLYLSGKQHLSEYEGTTPADVAQLYLAAQVR